MGGSEGSAGAGAGAGGGGGAAAQLNAYQEATKAIRDNIAALEQQAQTFGMTEMEATRFNTAMDLLKAAHEAGVPVTARVVSEINALADAYVEAEARAKELEQQQRLIDSVNSTLANGFTNMFTGLIDGTKSAVQAIGDLLSQLGRLLLNQAFTTLFSGPSVGGGIGSFLGSIFGGAPSFAGGGFTGYGSRSGGIDGRGGFPAILHPNETVVDHTQGGGANDNGPQVVIHNTINVPPGTSADVAPAIAREVTKELRKQIPDAIERYNRNPYRRAV
jgi:uncharacterized protein YqgV (UPF0045/DUF77 family)